MAWIFDLLSRINEYTNLYSWQDGIEILIIACAVYYFQRWLAHDTQKNLVVYFYSYCAALIGAHYTGLTTISELLLLAAPIIACVFIILHQHTLQKNFVSLKKIVPEQSSAHDWIDELMRTSLYAMNKGKSIIWVIERNDSPAASLQASCIFNAELKKDLLELLLEASTTTQECIIWVNQLGKLITCNAQWNIAKEQVWIAPDAQELPQWQQHALLISSKTDTIIIRSCAESRLCTIIAQEKSVEQLSAHHTTVVLKRLITHQSSFYEGVGHVNHPTQRPFDQQHS